LHILPFYSTNKPKGPRKFAEDGEIPTINTFTLKVGESIGKISLLVNSQLLLNALRSVVGYFADAPSGDNDSLKSGVFQYPFKDLVLHKDELLKYKEEKCAADGRHSEDYVAQLSRHLEILMNYLYNQPSLRLGDAEAQLTKRIPTTTFASFWLLVKPGSDVYVQKNGAVNAYVVESVDGGVNGRMASAYSIKVWNLAFDGTTINRQSMTVTVPIFDGEREVTSLPIFPMKYKENNEEFRSKLIQRGKKYFAFSKAPAFMEYTGWGLKEPYKSVSHNCLRCASGLPAGS
jgi:hypothetical protein